MGYPMEFDRQKNIVTGYDESLDLPMPNDDLDLQLLWLIALEEKGCHITTERLAEYWQRYLTPHWAEYGISKVNMRSGILPPMSGTVNNEMYKNSNGAWIRSEIWACLAPGRTRGGGAHGSAGRHAGSWRRRGNLGGDLLCGLREHGVR